MSKKLIGLLAGVSLFGAGAAFAGEGQATKEEQAQTETTQSTQPADSVDNQGSLDPAKGDEATGVGGSGEAGTGTSSSAQGATSGQDTSVSGTASGTTSGELGTGGAGDQDAKATQAQGAEAEGEQNLTGKVIKSQGNKVFVDHMGAIVELRTNSKTQFEGDVKRAKDLKEGDEIRASFTVKNQTQNQATSISKTQGTGGSGFEDLGTQDQGLDNTGSGLEPSSDPALEGGQGGAGMEGTGEGSVEGSGGAGIEGTTPDTMGTEPNSDLGTQTTPGSDVNSPPVDQSQSGEESGTQIQ